MIKLRELLNADVELTPDGQLRINSIDSITPEQWNQISRLMLQKGYDSRGGEDAKRAVKGFIERGEEPIVKHSHWAEVIAHVLGLSKMQSKKQSVPLDVQKKIMAAAIRTFGVTNNIKLAGWILPNGKLLNFSHEGSQRDKDHSEINTIFQKYGLAFGKESAPLYAIKEAFCLMGAIRINGDGPQIMIGKSPTTQQFQILDYLFHANQGAIDLDMVHPTHGTTGKTYTKGTKPKRIYYDIVNFYRSGQGPRDTLFEGKTLKWIIGYVDAYGAIHHKIIDTTNPIDSHNKVWPAVHHNKWRWMPSRPNEINTYGEELEDETIDRIWNIVDIYRRQ